MLTPQDVSSKEFVKAVFGGYDMSVVDDFLETLTEDYSALYKENAILKSKIKVLVEKVEEYRSTEDAMRMALLTAQKMGDDLLNEAKKKSDSMLMDTEASVKKRMSELSGEISDEETRLQAVKNSTAQFIGASQEIIKQHQVFLSKISEITTPEPEMAAEPIVAKEDKIVDAAKEIDSFVSNLLSDDPEPESLLSNTTKQESISSDPFGDETEPTKLYRVKNNDADDAEDDESPTPRPKFDFDNLQFGSNYSENSK